MSDCIISVKNLTKIYGSKETEVTAVNNISFDISEGEFVAIVGASGSGKSTLLHLIGAMDIPTSGEITVDGTVVTKSVQNDLAVFRRRKIGFIFQFFNLIPIMSVRDNILLPLSLDNQKPDEKYFNEITELLNLSDRLDSYPHQLSGGQQQRVSIARALIAKPSVILADEPTGNLDTKNSREIIALLKQSIKKYNQTLILITHDPSIAGEADRVIKLSDGKIFEAEG